MEPEDCNDDIRNNDNEESGVPCGTDGVCWVILFLDKSEETLLPKGESKLKPLVGNQTLSVFDTNPWKEPGTSKGCMLNAHDHSWIGTQNLGDAIDNAKDGVLKDVMYQEGKHTINIHFCKTYNCN